LHSDIVKIDKIVNKITTGIIIDAIKQK